MKNLESNAPTYSYSSNDQDFCGQYSTREEAALAGFDNETGVDELCIGENIKRSAREYVGAYQLIDDIQCSAYNDCHSRSEGWLDDLTAEQGVQLEILIGGWLDHVCPVNFYSITDTQHVKRSDYE